jgi:hypothetical protein
MQAILRCGMKYAAMRPVNCQRATVAIANRLRRQAATCARLARQTHDEESRQRCLQLEQTYLQLADMEMEESVGGQIFAGEGERNSAA